MDTAIQAADQNLVIRPIREVSLRPFTRFSRPPSGRLTERTLDTLRGQFQRVGHRPDTQTWLALEALADCLEGMARREAQPNFHLCSLYPGAGKTTAICAFVSALLEVPDMSDVGVVLCVPRLDMISTLTRDMGLPDGYLSVLTSDGTYNALGTASADKAQVLITTHAMILSRCRSQAFAEASEFFYRDKPRDVRVWDESVVPGMALSVSAPDLAFLITASARQNPKLSEAIARVFTDAVSITDGQQYVVPNFPESLGVDLNDALRVVEAWQNRSGDGPARRIQDDEKALVSALWMLAGKTVTVRRDGAYGAAILDYEETLPRDLAPMLICDASGGVRGTYEAWEEGRRNLVRLPSASKSYAGLKVNVWQRGGGKQAFRENTSALVEGIATEADRVLNEQPNAKLLFVVHRPEKGRMDVEQSIRSLLQLGVGDAERIRFTTWGAHDATNQFSDCSHVFLCGTLFYRPSFYEALGRAAAGKPSSAGEFCEDTLRKIVEGEHRHLILQAACRGTVRRSDGTVCKPMSLYVVASGRSGIPASMKTVFQDCRVYRWEPVRRPLGGKVGEVAQLLSEWVEWGQLQGQPVSRDFLPFRDVMRAIGVADAANFKNNIRNHSDLQDLVSSLGLIEDSRDGRGKYPKGWRLFDPASVFDNEDAKQWAEPEAIQAGQF